MLSTTTGDDSTRPPVPTRQSIFPFARLSPVTVPSCELTTSRGPAIAGDEAMRLAILRLHTMSPVSASIANVIPFALLTYRVPSQNDAGYSMNPMARPQTGRVGRPRSMSSRARVRCGFPPNERQQGPSGSSCGSSTVSTGCSSVVVGSSSVAVITETPASSVSMPASGVSVARR